MEWNWKRLAITGWVFAGICCLTAILFGWFLFNRNSHAIYHAVADDRGHRGFYTGDAAHRKAVAAIFAYGNVGQFGRFIADVADQVLMDDGETVLAVFLKDTDPTWPKHFISLPVEPKKMADALASAVKELENLGDRVEKRVVPVKTAKGTFDFALIRSSRLDFLIVLRPPTVDLGEPVWIPLEQ